MVRATLFLMFQLIYSMEVVRIVVVSDFDRWKNIGSIDLVHEHTRLLFKKSIEMFQQQEIPEFSFEIVLQIVYDKTSRESFPIISEIFLEHMLESLYNYKLPIGRMVNVILI